MINHLNSPGLPLISVERLPTETVIDQEGTPDRKETEE
jgi:hypothetical protein